MVGSYVCPYSYNSAKDCGELKLWRESHQQNIACMKDIRNTIRDNYDGEFLNADSANKVIGIFGYDRVNWVLAATIQRKSEGGKFSADNVEWAKGFFIPDITGTGRNHADVFAVESPPAELSEFIDQARKAYQALGLYDRSHCQGDNEHTDYTDKVLVLNPTILNEKYKTPQDQLVLARDGFGCSPTARGRKVFGEFLSDGEKCQYYRNDFLGVLKDDLLPGWAKQKLESMYQNTEAPQPVQGGNNGGGMTQSL